MSVTAVCGGNVIGLRVYEIAVLLCLGQPVPPGV